MYFLAVVLETIIVNAFGIRMGIDTFGETIIVTSTAAYVAYYYFLGDANPRLVSTSSFF